jgi:hypothetical protein
VGGSINLLVSSREQPFDALPVVAGNAQQYQSADFPLTMLDRGYVALCNTDRRRDIRLFRVKAAKLANSTSHSFPIDDDDMLSQFRC